MNELAQSQVAQQSVAAPSAAAQELAPSQEQAPQLPAPLDAVAAGRHRDELDRVARPAMGGDQGRNRHLGLRHGKGRSARADAEGRGGGWESGRSYAACSSRAAL